MTFKPAVALVAVALGAGIAPAPASAEYGPDTCISGFVWREARAGDLVCVAPGERDQVAQQNANPGANRNPNAGYGPLGCASGFVWREAFDGDTICVAPGFRQQMKNANAAANSRKVGNQAPPPPVPQPGVPEPQPGWGTAGGGGDIDFNEGADMDPCARGTMGPSRYPDYCMLAPEN